MPCISCTNDGCPLCKGHIFLVQRACVPCAKSMYILDAHVCGTPSSCLWRRRTTAVKKEHHSCAHSQTLSLKSIKDRCNGKERLMFSGLTTGVSQANGRACRWKIGQSFSTIKAQKIQYKNRLSFISYIIHYICVI